MCTAVVVVVVVVQRVEHHRRHRQHQHQFSSGRILCSSDCSHSFSWRQIFFASPVLFLLLLSKSQQAQLHFYMPAVVCVCPHAFHFPLFSGVETNADEQGLVVVVEEPKAPIRLVITRKLDNEILSRSSDALLLPVPFLETLTTAAGTVFSFPLNH